MDFFLRIHVNPEMQISLGSEIERTQWIPFSAPGVLSDITSVRNIKFLKAEDGFKKFEKLWKETGICAVIAKTDDEKYEEQNLIVLIPNYRLEANKFKCDVYLVPEIGVLSDAMKEMGSAESLRTVFPVDVANMYRMRLYKKVFLMSYPGSNCDGAAAEQFWNELVAPTWTTKPSPVHKNGTNYTTPLAASTLVLASSGNKTKRGNTSSILSNATSPDVHNFVTGLGELPEGIRFSSPNLWRAVGFAESTECSRNPLSPTARAPLSLIFTPNSANTGLIANIPDNTKHDLQESDDKTKIGTINDLDKHKDKKRIREEMEDFELREADERDSVPSGPIETQAATPKRKKSGSRSNTPSVDRPTSTKEQFEMQEFTSAVVSTVHSETKQKKPKTFESGEADENHVVSTRPIEAQAATPKRKKSGSRSNTPSVDAKDHFDRMVLAGKHGDDEGGEDLEVDQKGILLVAEEMAVLQEEGAKKKKKKRKIKKGNYSKEQNEEMEEELEEKQYEEQDEEQCDQQDGEQDEEQCDQQDGEQDEEQYEQQDEEQDEEQYEHQDGEQDEEKNEQQDEEQDKVVVSSCLLSEKKKKKKKYNRIREEMEDFELREADERDSVPSGPIETQAATPKRKKSGSRSNTPSVDAKDQFDRMVLAGKHCNDDEEEVESKLRQKRVAEYNHNEKQIKSNAHAHQEVLNLDSPINANEMRSSKLATRKLTPFKLHLNRNPRKVQNLRAIAVSSMPSTDSGADCDRAPDEDLTDSENENEIENETGSLAMVDLTEENHFQKSKEVGNGLIDLYHEHIGAKVPKACVSMMIKKEPGTSAQKRVLVKQPHSPEYLIDETDF